MTVRSSCSSACVHPESFDKLLTSRIVSTTIPETGDAGAFLHESGSLVRSFH